MFHWQSNRRNREAERRDLAQKVHPYSSSIQQFFTNPSAAIADLATEVFLLTPQNADRFCKGVDWALRKDLNDKKTVEVCYASRYAGKKWDYEWNTGNLGAVKIDEKGVTLPIIMVWAEPHDNGAYRKNIVLNYDGEPRFAFNGQRGLYLSCAIPDCTGFPQVECGYPYAAREQWYITPVNR